MYYDTAQASNPVAMRALAQLVVPVSHISSSEPIIGIGPRVGDWHRPHDESSVQRRRAEDDRSWERRKDVAKIQGLAAFLYTSGAKIDSMRVDCNNVHLCKKKQSSPLIPVLRADAVRPIEPRPPASPRCFPDLNHLRKRATVPGASTSIIISFRTSTSLTPRRIISRPALSVYEGPHDGPTRGQSVGAFHRSRT